MKKQVLGAARPTERRSGGGPWCWVKEVRGESLPRLPSETATSLLPAMRGFHGVNPMKFFLFHRGEMRRLSCEI